MRFHFISLIIFISGAQASAAEPSVRYNLVSASSVSWSRTDKNRHSLDCYPMGKGDQYSDLPGEVVSSKFSSDNMTTRQSLPVIAATQRVNIGNIDLILAHEAGAGDSDVYTFQIVDNLRWTGSQDIGGSKCNIHEFNWRVNSHRIQGDYSLNIRMPEDAWFVGLKIHSEGIAASLSGMKTKGDLHGVPLRNKELFYVWAKPGSVVEIPIKLDVQSSGGLQGKLTLTLQRRGLQSGLDPLKTLENSIKDLAPKNSEAVSAFLAAGAGIAGHPQVAKSIVNSMGLGRIQQLTDNLFKIAQGDFSGNPNELHLKAMGAAVGYELALALLDNLKVFCETKSIYLPLTNMTVERPGFIIANFWMNQTIVRLNEMHFPEVEAYLNEILVWEKKGMNYSDIAHSTQDFKKLTDGFVKIRQNSRLAWDVYGDIKGSLKKITAVFGNVGADAAAMERLYQRLDEISEQRRQVNSRFQKFIFGFVISNNEPIAASVLLNEILNLKSASADLAQQMNEVLKFVTIGEDGGENNVLAQMTGLLAHQVNVFELPLKSKFLEPIRMSFYQSDQTAALKAAYNRCLGGQ